MNFLFNGACNLNAMNARQRLLAKLINLGKAKGWTETEVAAHAGATSAQWSNWKKRGEVSKDGLAYIADHRPELLDENTEEGPEIRGHVPLISWVTAGQFNGAEDPLAPGEAEDWKPCPTKHGPRTYALRVRGDSMTSPHGRSYPDGCLIFVDPDQRSPNNGERIIAKLEGTDEVTFKCFQRDAGRIWLKPLNPQHPPILDPFKVIGTVIGKWEDE